MMTFAASPQTIQTPAQVTLPRPAEAVRTARPSATPRPGFLTTLLRALSAPAA